MRSTIRILVAVLCENAQFLFLCRLEFYRDSTATISTEIKRVSHNCCFIYYIFVRSVNTFYEPKYEVLITLYNLVIACDKDGDCGVGLYCRSGICVGKLNYLRQTIK